MRNFTAWLLAGFVWTTAVAQAQTVFRCGNAYGDTPCANSQPVDVSDARSAEQRDAAAEVVARDRRLAAELQQERRLRQASLKPAAAASLGGRPVAVVAAASHPAKPPHRKRHRYVALQDSDFIAVAPGSGRKPKKAASP